MAMNTPDRGTRTMLSEINVTPFVDVMLVLLIIFMVVAPNLQQGIDVALPAVDSKPMIVEPDNEIIITINKDGRIFVGDTEVTQSTLRAELKELSIKKNKKEIFLKADKDVRYGLVAIVLAEARAAGIESLGMITEPPGPPAETEKPEK